MSGWRLPLRIARRDAQRARGRSILMLVMIALPVMGVTAADVLIQTQDVNSAESLDRRLGTQAAAKVFTFGEQRTAPQQQSLDPEFGGSGQIGDENTLPAPTLRSVLRTLGGSRPALTLTDSMPTVQTTKGRTDIGGTEIDLRDPLASGMFRLVSGRWPTSTDEVVVNKSLRDRIDGATITLSSGSFGAEPETLVTRTVVGIAESASVRNYEQVAGLPGSLPKQEGSSHAWLVGGTPVTWDDVKNLNAVGALVVSRAVIEHPSNAALAADAELTGGGGTDETAITVAILVVVMSLIEVVLLAGPAFAVGARRQARPLALLAACGGTPKQARRVVLATGVVIGTAGAIAGVVLGIVVARVLAPILQQFNGSWFGPFQVPWLHLVGVAVFGFLSALLAAVVPAWIASRQDVVAVLAGRRGDRKPSARSPYVGVVLMVCGVGLAWVGTRQAATGSAAAIGISAILCVLGMLFLIPVVVVGLAKLCSRLPLALRFAVRDAARHRSRTTPAIAAVAATVAGVVALGIGTSSDEARNRAFYQPQLAMGAASLSADSEAGKKLDWKGYEAAVLKEVPDAEIQRIRGVAYESKDGFGHELSFTGAGGEPLSPDGFGGSVSTDVLIYKGELPKLVTGLSGFDSAAAKKVLDNGGVVVFSGGNRYDAERYTGKIKTGVTSYSYEDVEGGGDESGGPATTTATTPGVTMHLASSPPVAAIVTESLARKLGLEPKDVGLGIVGATISKDQEKNIQEALNAMPVGSYLYVERGYQASSDAWIIQLVLAGLAAILMLGGTLTATFLALSDARPDLATLSAIGAAPRTRRRIAAAYAVAIGGVGAVLGVLVGFVPGIAVTYPITSQGWNPCDGEGCPGMPDNFLDIPWLLIGGVVVILPALVAGLVWLFARSRLPLVSRLS